MQTATHQQGQNTIRIKNGIVGYLEYLQEITSEIIGNNHQHQIITQLILQFMILMEYLPDYRKLENVLQDMVAIQEQIEDKRRELIQEQIHCQNQIIKYGGGLHE